MQWAFPAMLVGLLAVAIPVLLHLLRRPPRPIVVASLQFVPRGVTVLKRRFRLHELLLLLLRTAALALLALAFAHPYRMAASAGAEQHYDHEILLLDASLSMRAREASGEQTLWQSALDQARKRIDNLPFDTSWTAITYADRMCEAVHSSSQKRNALRGWDQSYPTCAASDLNKALDAVRFALGRYPGDVRVTWYTDLQRSSLARMDSASLPSRVHLDVVPLVGRQDNRQVWFERDVAFAASTDSIELAFRTTADFGPGQLGKRATVWVDDRPVEADFAALDADGPARYRLTLDPLPPGLYGIRLQIELEDALADDDVDHVALVVEQPWSVLCVEAERHCERHLSEALYLREALSPQAAGAAWFGRADVIAAAELGGQRLSSYDVVCLINLDQLAGSDAEKLTRYVEDGGGLLVAAGTRSVGGGVLADLAQRGLAPARPAGPVYTSDTARPYFQISDWDDAHPAMAWLAAASGDGLKLPRFYRLMAGDAKEDAAVLLWMNNRVPLVIAGTLGNGRVLSYASTVDRQWNDLPRSAWYLPLMRELIRWLADRPDPSRRLQTEEITAVRTEEGWTRPGILLPASSTDPIVKRMLPSAELDLARGTTVALERKLGQYEDEVTPALAGSAPRRDERLLSWLLLAVVACIALESIFANHVIAG